MYARTTDAVASGRNEIEDSSRSWKEYISLETTSVLAPIDRAKSSVCSKIGKRISAKPKVPNTSRAVCSTRFHSADSGGRISRTPLMAWNCLALFCVEDIFE